MTRLKLALLGCGDVAQRDYLPEFHRVADRAEIVAVCTRSVTRMKEAMQRYAIPNGYTDYHQMLAESDAQAVINLTPIALHDETNFAILESGRHLYSEKPVASRSFVAQQLAEMAQARGLQAACAPSIRLFPQMQYVLRLIEEGTIGPVYSARGYGHFGVPLWTGYFSDPSPFFAAGAGPMMDMGVYPLHALTTLIGPVRRVVALVTKVHESFTITEGPYAGLRVPVEADDHWHVLLDFGGGCIASVAANAVVVDTRCPPLELHGLSGTIAFDPIYVQQPVEVLSRGCTWETMRPPFPETNPGRSAGPDHILGVVHLLDCIEGRCSPQLSLDQAAHVLRVIEAAAESARTGCAIKLN